MKNLKQIIHHILGLFFVRKNNKSMVGDTNIIRYNHSELFKECPDENIWLKRWSQFGKASPIFFRIYSRCLKDSINRQDIIPDDVARSFIEPALNPASMTSFYNDKNSLGLIVNSQDMPKVLMRNINGILYDSNYHNVIPNRFEDVLGNTYMKIVVKPSNEQGGSKVSVFQLVNGGGYEDKNGNHLNLNYLSSKYKSNYLVQEYFVQSDFTRQFNPSSVNTIRMATYRDINNGKIHILGSVIRIGNAGSEVDNASAGGVFVGIDSKGKLMDVTWDHNCNRKNIHNGIDFASQTFVVPNYNKVEAFAKRITERLPHMSLLALDIVLDENNEPKLIEVNSHSFTWYFYQFPTGPAFGQYTEDVFNYCLKHKNDYKVTAYRYLSKHN